MKVEHTPEDDEEDEEEESDAASTSYSWQVVVSQEDGIQGHGVQQ